MRLIDSRSLRFVRGGPCESGQTFWGVPEDFQAIAETATTPPRLEKILLLPILVDNRTIAVVYGDYGLGHAAHGQCERLSILAKTAGLVLEKVLRQKNRQFELLISQ